MLIKALGPYMYYSPFNLLCDDDIFVYLNQSGSWLLCSVIKSKYCIVRIVIYHSMVYLELCPSNGG